ncbi:MAG: hypothetical protein ACRD96_29530, partial [Bryobacteraceae bacterium]
VYVPDTSNVLRDRERHIALLESERATKNEWLARSQGDLVALNADHQTLLDRHRRLIEELEQSNRWAEDLNRQLAETGARVLELQLEIADEHSAARAMAGAYEAKVAELEADTRAKAQWAIDTEARLAAELDARARELVECVRLLHDAEATLEARTAWARSLQKEVDELGGQLARVRASRYVRLGRVLGVGPALNNP